MSIKSTNLQLNLIDTALETTTDFQAWRRAMDGYGYDTPSNMEIIDAFAAETKTALASKVSNAHGAEGANKVLATDENGNVVLKDEIEVDLTDYATKEEVEGVKESLQTLDNDTKAALNTKLSVSQGAENVGKFLSVGDDGNIILVDKPESDNSIDEEFVNDLIDKKIKLLVATSVNDAGGLTYIFDVAADNT